MAHSAVERAFLGEPQRETPITLGRFLPERWTGLLTLELETLAPLVIGTGWFMLHETRVPPERSFRKPARRKIAGKWVLVESLDAPSTEEKVIAEIFNDVVRSSGDPVVPGSSIKGAVRQVYELLTPSCDLLARDSCKGYGKSPKVCPACSLFGAQGLGGRVAFFETRIPASQLGTYTVPEGWGDQDGNLGTVRVYDGQPTVRRAQERTWGIQPGTIFQSKVRVVNASDDELGLLFASLGLGYEEGPSLRLGGKKYHGFGGMRARLVRTKPEVQAEALDGWRKQLQEAALASEERRATFDRLHRALVKAPEPEVP